MPVSLTELRDQLLQGLWQIPMHERSSTWNKVFDKVASLNDDQLVQEFTVTKKSEYDDVVKAQDTFEQLKRENNERLQDRDEPLP